MNSSPQLTEAFCLVCMKSDTWLVCYVVALSTHAPKVFTGMSASCFFLEMRAYFRLSYSRCLVKEISVSIVDILLVHINSIFKHKLNFSHDVLVVIWATVAGVNMG